MNLKPPDAFGDLLELFLVQRGIHECPGIVVVGSLNIIPYFVLNIVRIE